MKVVIAILICLMLVGCTTKDDGMCRTVECCKECLDQVSNMCKNLSVGERFAADYWSSCFKEHRYEFCQYQCFDE